MEGLRNALRANAAQIAEALLGPPNRTTPDELRWGRRGSLAVRIRGPKAGLARDHEADDGGDLLWLIQRERRCNFAEAAKWAADMVGMPWDTGEGADHGESERRRTEQPQRDAEAQAERQRRVNAAREIWQRSVPTIDGTIAETYLTEIRKIAKPANGWPDVLRYLPDQTVKITGHDAQGHESARTIPTAGALVIAATLPDSTVTGVQRIYLQPDGDNLRLSDRSKVKLSRGVFDTGAAARLSGPADGPLLVTEGPETGLSVWRATSCETWIAFGSLSKLQEVPADRLIVVCRDDDPLYSPADQALNRIITEWREAGVKVVIATPWAKPRDDKSDFNDVLKNSGIDAVKERIDLSLLHDQARTIAAIEAAGGDAIKLVIRVFRQVLLTEGEHHPLIEAATSREPLVRAAAKQAGVNLTTVRKEIDAALKIDRQLWKHRERAAHDKTQRKQRQMNAARNTLPEGFHMEADGLWFDPPPVNSTTPPPIWICGPFKMLGETRSDHSDAWGVYLEWQDRDGTVHRFVVGRRLAHQRGNEIAEQLSDAGLMCDTDVTAHELIKRFFGTVRSTHRKLCVSHTGWQARDDRRTFVLPGGDAFGPDHESMVFQPEHTEHAALAYRSKGTLKDWQTKVGAKAIGNSRLILAISTAFAGPLLEINREQSGGVHAWGPSRIGKTTLARAGASVWGPPTPSGQLRSWDASATGIEAVAAQTTDTMLILDEIAQADARSVEQIIYRLANEGGRHRGTPTASAQRRRTWRTMIFSTGEKKIADKLAEIDKKPSAGMAVRLTDLPADAGEGHGVFEMLHGCVSGGELSEYLKAATLENYGLAGRAFVQRLADDLAHKPDELRAAQIALRDFFLKTHLPAQADGQVRSVASHFALIGTGGELAAEYQVVPWKIGQAMEAAATCFKAWVAKRGGSGRQEDIDAFRQVRLFLETHGEARFTLASKGDEDAPRTINRAGFRRKGADGEWEFLVFPETWVSDVCRSIDARHTADLLAERGLLTKGKDGRTRSEYIPCEGKNRRVYVVTGAILAGDDDAQ